MDEALKAIGLAIGVGAGISGWALLVYVVITIFKNPDKVDLWRALFYRMLMAFGSMFKSAHKQYVRYDLQGRVNEFARALSKEAPYLATTKVKVEYVGTETTRESFLKDDEVILRLRSNDRNERNFVHGACLITAACLLHKTRRYMAKTQREAVELYVVTKLLQREKPSVVNIYLEEYLHPKWGDGNTKIAKHYAAYDRLDKGALFFPVFLRELDFLGNKVFGGPRKGQIQAEISALIEFLDKVAQRKVGDEGDLEFNREYCRVGIVIVGRSAKIAASGAKAWVKYIRNNLEPHHTETIYLVGAPENKGVIDEVCDAFDGTYERYHSSIHDIEMKASDGTLLKRKRYIVILRVHGINVYQSAA
ncbi:MAG: hypothetical protein IVW55_12025 [Chloroflexi bacterium]|nr:hypothetical protein [Chloroflexota bacterium]